MALWGGVLVGGDGTRMQVMTEKCFGLPIPKQYCTFCGTRSMLEHTLERASRLASHHRLVTIVTEKHCVYFDENRLPGYVIKQPFSRDTAPGIFLPAAHVKVRDGDATVLILPSDHFIYPDDDFVRNLEHLVESVEDRPEMIGLLGVKPSGPETDYGWIAPADPPSSDGEQKHGAVRRILRFEEKPDSQKAKQHYSRGYLWNTLILVAKVQTLWKLGLQTIPSVTEPLDHLQNELARASLNENGDYDLVSRVYQALPRVNFSSAFLTRVTKHTLVYPLEGVQWSDWGRPQRVLETLKSINKAPAFPPSIIDELG